MDNTDINITNVDKINVAQIANKSQKTRAKHKYNRQAIKDANKVNKT